MLADNQSNPLLSAFEDAVEGDSAKKPSSSSSSSSSSSAIATQPLAGTPHSKMSRKRKQSPAPPKQAWREEKDKADEEEDEEMQDAESAQAAAADVESEVVQPSKKVAKIHDKTSVGANAANARTTRSAAAASASVKGGRGKSTSTFTLTTGAMPLTRPVLRDVKSNAGGASSSAAAPLKRPVTAPAARSVLDIRLMWLLMYLLTSSCSQPEHRGGTQRFRPEIRA